MPEEQVQDQRYDPKESVIELKDSQGVIRLDEDILEGTSVVFSWGQGVGRIAFGLEKDSQANKKLEDRIQKSLVGVLMTMSVQGKSTILFRNLTMGPPSEAIDGGVLWTLRTPCKPVVWWQEGWPYPRRVGPESEVEKEVCWEGGGKPTLIRAESMVVGDIVSWRGNTLCVEEVRADADNNVYISGQVCRGMPTSVEVKEERNWDRIPEGSDVSWVGRWEPAVRPTR